MTGTVTVLSMQPMRRKRALALDLSLGGGLVFLEMLIEGKFPSTIWRHTAVEMTWSGLTAAIRTVPPFNARSNLI